MKKLNLGCGTDIREGWINLDNHDKNGANFIFDLNKLKLPFQENFFDYIFCSHVLEDFVDADKLMDEFVRICKVGGKIEIRVPNETMAWGNIHHKKAFNLKSFLFYSTPKSYGESLSVLICDLCYYGLTNKTKKEVNFIGRLYFAICVFVGNLLPITIMCETVVKYIFPRLNIKVVYIKVV